MHVSYSFSEAELVKAVLLINFSNRLCTKRLASL